MFFDGDRSFSIFPPDDRVLLENIYDPFTIWFAVSLALLAAGFILYPLHYFIENDARQESHYYHNFLLMGGESIEMVHDEDRCDQL